MNSLLDFGLTWSESYVDSMASAGDMGGGFFPTAKEYAAILFSGIILDFGGCTSMAAYPDSYGTPYDTSAR